MEKEQFNPNDFRERFSEYSIEDCIDAFNSDVGNPGWVSARGRFHAALMERFLESGYDCSSFIDVDGGKHGARSMSVSKKIRIEGDKIIT